ncbi:hypothetical protein [Kineococcus glutinatus]|uniref:Uncharacterized protein n=1 Tax=Kineococcus glutinatus TaxID=1070872 RepID=A0ABP9HPX7_9ACTN
MTPEPWPGTDPGSPAWAADIRVSLDAGSQSAPQIGVRTTTSFARQPSRHLATQESISTGVFLIHIRFTEPDRPRTGLGYTRLRPAPQRIQVGDLVVRTEEPGGCRAVHGLGMVTFVHFPGWRVLLVHAAPGSFQLTAPAWWGGDDASSDDLSTPHGTVTAEVTIRPATAPSVTT